MEGELTELTVADVTSVDLDLSPVLDRMHVQFTWILGEIT